MRAERAPWPEQLGQMFELDEITGVTAPLFERHQHLHAPRQTVAARRAPAAGFAREEFFKIAHDGNHVLLVVDDRQQRSEEHTSELQSLMRISYAVFCLKKKRRKTK